MNTAKNEPRTRQPVRGSLCLQIALRSPLLEVRALVLAPEPRLGEVELLHDELLTVVGFIDHVAARVHDERLAGEVHPILTPHAVAHGDEDLVLHRLHADLPLEELHGFGFCVRRRNDDEVRPP